MEVIDARSSSNDLSSAPPSDAESTPGPLSHLTHRDTSMAGNLGVAGRSPFNSAQSLLNNASAASAGTRQDATPATAVKTRKPRKKRDPSAPEPEKKERVPRKPRGSSSTAAVISSRKKPKLEQLDGGSTINLSRHASAGLQSSTLIQPVSFTNSGLNNSSNDVNTKTSTSGDSVLGHTQISPHQSYDYTRENQTVATSPAQQPPAQPLATTRPAMYDPIRAMNISRLVDPTPPPSSTSQLVHTPPRPTYNASTSPAISGIINPPVHNSSAQSTVNANHSPLTSAAYPPTNGKLTNSPLTNGQSSLMNIDQISAEQLPVKKSLKKTPSEAPTRATSPKPVRVKEQAPPPPPGSGLLSASLFGGDSSMEGTEREAGKAPSIVLHVDIRDPNNRVVNFGRLAENKYGFAALYPRQAAQKERLAKVAAAGAALERSASGSKFGGTSAGESGDEDLSVDIERESDNDGDIAMSGINGGQEAANSGTDAPGPKRRRRRKQEEYDQDDPFVDDSEMLWETQAAASKDGFFVYCGPLVPEGEKPAVERADGTIKRGRGRGRGGGPGSRGGRAGAAAAAEGGASRGGGPGSRGGGTTRKPRITKAERAQREQEKLAREKMAPIMAKPSAYPG